MPLRLCQSASAPAGAAMPSSPLYECAASAAVADVPAALAGPQVRASFPSAAASEDRDFTPSADPIGDGNGGGSRPCRGVGVSRRNDSSSTSRFCTSGEAVRQDAAIDSILKF